MSPYVYMYRIYIQSEYKKNTGISVVQQNNILKCLQGYFFLSAQTTKIFVGTQKTKSSSKID